MRLCYHNSKTIRRGAGECTKVWCWSGAQEREGQTREGMKTPHSTMSCPVHLFCLAAPEFYPLKYTGKCKWSIFLWSVSLSSILWNLKRGLQKLSVLLLVSEVAEVLWTWALSVLTRGSWCQNWVKLLNTQLQQDNRLVSGNTPEAQTIYLAGGTQGILQVLKLCSRKELSMEFLLTVRSLCLERIIHPKQK